LIVAAHLTRESITIFANRVAGALLLTDAARQAAATLALCASAVLQHSVAIGFRAPAEIKLPLDERISRVAVVPHKRVQLRELSLELGLSRTRTP
jgi:hypothetical protein